MILGKASRFALYALTMMAKKPGERLSAAAIADAFDISENHVAKVLQQLTRAELIAGVRGPKGGYTLVGDPAQITMFDVVQLFEVGLSPDSCEHCPFRQGGACAEDATACRIHGVLAELESHVFYTLKSITIATLAARDRTRSVA